MLCIAEAGHCVEVMCFGVIKYDSHTQVDSFISIYFTNYF